jgi:hypothetical protein
MRIRNLFIFCFLLLGVICFAYEDNVAVDTLTQQSDRIVRGKVRNLSSRAGRNEYGDELIYSDIYISVTEALKGDRSDLILTVEGGTVNGITLTVSDSPEFRIGEEILVFVKKDVLTNRPFGGLRSKYTIADGRRVLQNGMNYGEFKTSILQALRSRIGER